MIKNLDDSVGEIFKALYINNMLNNTIFVFMSDNGAPTNGIHRNHGSNWPLKGVSVIYFIKRIQFSMNIIIVFKVYFCYN